jgi:CheY-like chemotaxis protein
LKREGKQKDFVLHIALTSTEASNIHPPEGRDDMPRIQALSHLRRHAEYYGEHQQQTDDLMSQYLQDAKQPGESAIRNRRSNDRHAMLVQRGGVDRWVMSEMLSILGYRVMQVDDVCKALLYFGRDACEVVISELDMPQFKGFQLARCIRKHSPQTRILLMTPCCQAEVVKYMESRLVDGWLFKPFRMDVLKDMLESVKDLKEEVG